jgi:hypothetical protein
MRDMQLHGGAKIVMTLEEVKDRVAIANRQRWATIDECHRFYQVTLAAFQRECPHEWSEFQVDHWTEDFPGGTATLGSMSLRKCNVCEFQEKITNEN